MKYNLTAKDALALIYTISTIIILFYIADGTRFYALTYDGVRYLFESLVERGINYAFSLECYFYRFFIFQLGKLLPSFTSLQNFHFFLFIIVFIQANFLLYKYFSFRLLIALNSLMILNLYANGLIFVEERETILSFLTFGFFSFTFPIFTNFIALFTELF